MSRPVSGLLPVTRARDEVRLAVWVTPLTLYLVALLVRLVVMAWVPFPPTEGSLYYLDVARNLVSGEGLVTNVQWSYATPPIGVPRPAFDLWLPLATFIDALPMLLLGATHQAGQVGMALFGATIAPLAWAVTQEAGALDGLGGRRTGAAAIGAGVLAAILGPWLVATAGPDSTVPFAVLGSLDALLIARLLRHAPDVGSRSARSRLMPGLILGLALGVTYLARQEVVWIGLTLVLLAIPRIARSGAGTRLATAARLLGPVVVGGAIVVLPWLMRQQLAFGGEAAGQVMDNVLLLRNEQIFAFHDTPTLGAFLAQGAGTLAGNVLRAIAAQLTDTVLLGAFPVGIAGIVAAIGLRRRQCLRVPSALAVLLLSGTLTFAATALLFPVATLWGTFQHASGPLLLGLIVTAVLGMDALMTRISLARGWDPVNVIVGPAALVALTVPVSLIQVASVRDSALDMERRIEAVALALESVAATADDPVADLAAPLMSDHPMSLAWTLERPVLVLPDDPPATLGELARLTGARQLVILDERGRYPEVLLRPAGVTCLVGSPARIDVADAPAWLFRLDPGCAS